MYELMKQTSMAYLVLRVILLADSGTHIKSQTRPKSTEARQSSFAPLRTSTSSPSGINLVHTQSRLSGGDDLTADKGVAWIEETAETYQYTNLQALKAIRLI